MGLGLGCFIGTNGTGTTNLDITLKGKLKSIDRIDLPVLSYVYSSKCSTIQHFIRAKKQQKPNKKRNKKLCRENRLPSFS